jgi:hypothetical protein
MKKSRLALLSVHSNSTSYTRYTLHTFVSTIPASLYSVICHVYSCYRYTHPPLPWISFTWFSSSFFSQYVSCLHDRPHRIDVRTHCADIHYHYCTHTKFEEDFSVEVTADSSELLNRPVGYLFTAYHTHIHPHARLQ